jgi:16S rRNA (guanine966-N2)-methyltransferase
MGGKRQPRVEPEIKIVSDSQITDGKFRGKSLLNSPSPLGAPTQRKIREVIFRVLARRVKAGRILDLGAACGTIGIEAISRGAMLVTFVERSARMCTLLRKNLEELGIRDGHGEVVEMEAMPFLVRSSRRKRMWDIVYLDMPCGDPHTALVEYLGRGSNIKQSGLLVIQHAATATFPEKISKLNRWRTVDQGETILSIYERI